jgi:A/G-specific adenine glycosylase
VSDFATLLTSWHKRHGRKDLPWQGTTDPYRIWLSEVMLQQTQVAAVVPYYARFLDRFPTIEELAAADEEAVLQLWSGLGYYARGRNLHRASRQVVSEWGGRFPESAQKIGELPGIGRSTAAAIAAFAYGERAAILDGNVKRVLARCYGIEGWPGERAVETRLWQLAERLLPKKHIEIYTQALMDLGATLCTRAKPRCEACPVNAACVARKKGLTGSIPGARPRKAVPTRRATWLLLVFQNQILLEKRPSAGLWGGLWSFPEYERKEIQEYCASALGCRITGTRELGPLAHGFTHFHLRIRPVMCEVASVTPRAEAGGRMWLDIEDASGAAVPTPVRTLLEKHLGARAGRARPTSPAAPASRPAAGAGSRRAAR